MPDSLLVVTSYRPTPNFLGQRNNEFRVTPLFRLQTDLALVLMHHNAVAYGKPQASSDADRLGSEERIKNPVPKRRGNAVAVIPDPNLDTVSEIPGSDADPGYEPATSRPGLLLGSIKGVVQKVEENLTELLWFDRHRCQ